MPRIIYGKDITLGELREQFGVKPAAIGEAFLMAPDSELPTLSADETSRLERVRKHYGNLREQRYASEEIVKMIFTSPLLDLAGFYDAPFALETERAIELEESDGDSVIRGKIDVLVLQKQLWVLVIESKRFGLDVMVALPQALVYMLDAPRQQEPLYGLLVNGREFVFVKLTRQNGLEYATSRAFSIVSPREDLSDVLRWLKYLRQTIAPMQPA